MSDIWCWFLWLVGEVEFEFNNKVDGGLQMTATKGGGLEGKNLISGDAVEVHRNFVSNSG
jgi:hypothetical protein